MKPFGAQHSAKCTTFGSLLTACFLAGAGSIAADSAQAGGFVIVNGVRLNPAQIAGLEAHCGPILDGYYRYDWSTGAWGFENDPWPRGNIRNCGQHVPRPSLSQRRQLFRPGELSGMEIVGGGR